MFFDYELKNFNFRLLLYVLLLNIIGVLCIRSATGQNSTEVVRQITGIMAGILVLCCCSLVDYHRVLSVGGVIYAGCIVLLIAVLLFGKNINHATRWLVLPGIGQIQPSEFVKIGLIAFLASFFSKNQDRIDQVKVLGTAVGLFGIIFLLIFAEPDLSTGLVTAFVFLCMIFVTGISYKWILGAIAVLLPVGGLFSYLLQYNMVPLLKDYQVRRILAFIDPAKYAEANLQQNNSIMAIGSGMLNGKGLNNNTLASVKNGNFLSEEQTDFIFAVIGEELGFIGCMVVIGLIMLIVFECLGIAARAKDLQGKLIGTGMAALVAFQSFANIAVATGIFPNTGLPLPFISYGVSSLLSIYIGMGMVFNVGLQRKISNGQGGVFL